MGLENIDESKLTPEEKETLKTLKKFEIASTYGTEAKFQFPEGKSYHSIILKELSKGISGYYEAFIRIPKDKKRVEFGIAYAHYGAEELGSVNLLADHVLLMDEIDIIGTWHDIGSRPSYLKKIHYVMDRENTERLKDCLKAG